MRMTRQQTKKEQEASESSPDSSDFEQEVPVKLHATRNRVKDVPDIPLPRPSRRSRPLNDNVSPAPHANPAGSVPSPRQSHIATGSARPNFGNAGRIPKRQGKLKEPAKPSRGEGLASGSQNPAESTSTPGIIEDAGLNDEVAESISTHRTVEATGTHEEVSNLDIQLIRPTNRYDSGATSPYHVYAIRPDWAFVLPPAG